MAQGTTPAGTETEQQAARWVQDMFAGVAPRYDLLNHLLSFNIDRGWRRALLESLAPVLAHPDASVLDLCCGTGDVMLDLAHVSQARIIGADFCHPMLLAAQKKTRQKNSSAQLFEADALALPLAANTLDALSIAFGYRNLTGYQAALIEFRRVLKPGGVLAILEFSHPRAALTRAVYGFYSRAVLPLVGGLISGSREAYSYLPESIRKFPHADVLEQMLQTAGFAQTRVQLLSGGIAALHTGLAAEEA